MGEIVGVPDCARRGVDHGAMPWCFILDRRFTFATRVHMANARGPMPTARGMFSVTAICRFTVLTTWVLF